MTVGDVFKRLKSIEDEVRNFKNGLSWHDLANAAVIYKQAFGIKLPSIPDEIRTGIKLRHDIVHRNGKTPEGKEQPWTKDQIKALKKVVQEFATEIEEQMKALPPEPPKPEPGDTPQKNNKTKSKSK